MHSSWGTIRIWVRDGKTVACRLPRVTSQPTRPFRWGGTDWHVRRPGDRDVLLQAERFVRGVFKGVRKPLPPIELPPGPEFTRHIWRKLSSIPMGHVLTYGELARRAGRAKAARAAGRACGANALPIFIPCHRVVGANGSPGGYSCGPAWKQLLLEREGAPSVYRSP